VGLDVELHHCSSDNGSLDGVYIPALDTALIDGTSPHIVDPRNPGAVDTIIHLGDFWDETGMRHNREAILRCNREVGRLFRRAYGYLAAAKTFNDQYEACHNDSGAVDFARLNTVTSEIIESIFADAPQVKDRKPRDRHLFASAITPEGPWNHLETLFGHLKRRFIVTGLPGTGKTTLVRRVAEAGLLRGYHAEIFHCSLDPTRYDHVIFPELGVAVVNASEPHTYEAKSGDFRLDTAEVVDGERLSRFAEEMDRARELHQTSLGIAVSFIKRAKATHDEMEAYYIPNMRFAEIDAKRDEILSQLLSAATAAVVGIANPA
jgi:hypothetical protein